MTYSKYDSGGVCFSVGTRYLHGMDSGLHDKHDVIDTKRAPPQPVLHLYSSLRSNTRYSHCLYYFGNCLLMLGFPISTAAVLISAQLVDAESQRQHNGPKRDVDVK